MDKVTHFELPTKDMNRAKKFYADTFGWKMQEAMPGYCMAYTCEVDEKQMPKDKGAINGGLMSDEECKTPCIVIQVDSLDESLEKVKAAGCEVTTPKQTIKDMGYYARFKDTEGNIVGLWQNMKKE